MEKDRGTKVLAIAAILIAVIGMTIGFASFSTVLNINGEATVKGSKWEIVFSDLEDAELVGSAKEVTTPTIKNDSTLIETYKAELTTPGDSISYTFNIRNKGTYDAEISAISMAGIGEKQLTVSGGNPDDHEKVKSKLSYTLTYVGGAKDGQAVAVGDLLPKRENETDGIVTVKLTLTYQEFTDESLLPQDTITIGGLDVAITYQQSNG